MLASVASLALLLGALVILVGGIWFIVEAFRENLLWGLGVLFLPILPLVFLILHWRRAKDPFVLQLYGIGIILIAHWVFGAALPG